MEKEHIYTAEFFNGQSEGSLRSAREILGLLYPILKPKSCIDIGCGTGAWLKAAAELGVNHYLGVDGDYVDTSHLFIDANYFRSWDLRTSLFSETGEAASFGNFDLAICCELAEHLAYDRAKSLVSDLTRLSDVVVFSAAIPYQGGENHLNEQWPEYWSILFRGQGFVCYDPVREKTWNNTDVDWWYSQNVLVFIKKGTLQAQTASRHWAEARGRLSLVHPRNYLQQALIWFYDHRFSAYQEEHSDLSKVLASYGEGATDVPSLDAVQRAMANPGYRDVFPWTRSDKSFPENIIAELKREKHHLKQSLNEIQSDNNHIPTVLQTDIQSDNSQNLKLLSLAQTNLSLTRMLEVIITGQVKRDALSEQDRNKLEHDLEKFRGTALEAQRERDLLHEKFVSESASYEENLTRLAAELAVTRKTYIHEMAEREEHYDKIIRDYETDKLSQIENFETMLKGAEAEKSRLRIELDEQKRHMNIALYEAREKEKELTNVRQEADFVISKIKEAFLQHLEELSGNFAEVVLERDRAQGELKMAINREKVASRRALEVATRWRSEAKRSRDDRSSIDQDK